jgi:hypothetical protein
MRSQSAAHPRTASTTPRPQSASATGVRWDDAGASPPAIDGRDADPAACS